MESVIGSVSTREIAAGIWLGAFLAWLIFFKPTRKSVRSLFNAFFQPALISPLLIAAVYAGGEIYLLDRIGWWSLANLKTTVFWLVTFAFLTMFEVATAKNRGNSLTKVTRNIVTVTGVLVFITELHSFPLLVELVALPLVTVVVLMSEIAKHKPEHASVTKLLGCMSVIIGFLYLGYSLWKSIDMVRETATWAVVLEFLNPVILSLGFIPFLYGWRAYVAYSDVFSTLSIFSIEKELIPYAGAVSLIVTCL